jgi:hypothetical protein
MLTFRNTLSVPYEDGRERECSETLAYKIQTSENYPEESISNSEHGETLKSRLILFLIPVLSNKFPGMRF